MNYRGIIVAGAIAIGLYLFSKTKKISDIAAERKTVRSGLSAVPPTIRQRTAQKVAQKIAQKVAQKVAPKRIGQPTARAAYIAALRRAAAQRAAAQRAAAQRAAAQRAAAQRAAAQRAAAQRAAAQRAAAQRAAAQRAAARKAAVRKAAAQKIGKKIGKTVAQNIAQKIKTRRAVIARYAKRQRPQIQRPRPSKKQIASRLFSGAEKSRIIPYSESSRHSYYGPKSMKLQNEGYGKGKAERDRKQALEFRLNELRAMFPESNL